MRLYEFDCSDCQRQLKGQYNDIFVFAMRFILAVFQSGLVNKDDTQLGQLEFTVEGKECAELFNAFLDTYVNAYPYDIIEKRLDFEMNYLTHVRNLSHLESTRLFWFCEILKKHCSLVI